MSYSIFYRAMFIKMNDGTYIPMIESGDNNVWEADNRRRAREWSSCRWLFETQQQKDRCTLSRTEITALAQQLVNNKIAEYEEREAYEGNRKYTKQDVLNDFFFFSSISIQGKRDIKASTFLNFIQSGFRNEVTYDMMRNAGCAISLTWWDKDHHHHLETVADEQQLYDKWNSFLNQGIHPYVGLNYGAERLWDDMKNLQKLNRKPASSTPKKEYFIVSMTIGSVEYHVLKLTSRRLRYTSWPDNARRYANFSSAQKAADSISKRFNGVSNPTVKRIPIAPAAS